MGGAVSMVAFLASSIQWLFRQSVRNIGSIKANHGITRFSILALTACSASAFLVLHDAERQGARRGSKGLFPPPAGRVYCDYSLQAVRKADTMLQRLANRDEYLRMEVPERALISSHVIYGQLLKENLIESYTAYKLASVSGHTMKGDVVVATAKLGNALDGHPNVVHGGILALLIDDVLGFSYEALQVPAAVTANLNVNYRAGVAAGSQILLKTTLTERKDRKLVWSVQVTSLDQETLYCEATSVFVIPRKVYESMQQTNETE